MLKAVEGRSELEDLIGRHSSRVEGSSTVAELLEP